MKQRAMVPVEPREPALRSLVGRVAAASALIAIAAVALLFAVTYSTVSLGLTRALAAGVDSDLAGLADIYATSGRAELVARIADREAFSGREGRDTHYALRENGRRVAGDLQSWPNLATAQSPAAYFDAPGVGRVYARATKLAPDLELLVTRGAASEQAILTRVTGAFALGGLAIAVAVLGFAWWRSRALARRLQRINEAYAKGDERAIAALIADERSDEVGMLARHSGRALHRQQRLLDGQRHASDAIAHELRTPLSHLDGRLRGLLDDASESAVAATVALAGADIRRITTTLDSLLDIAAHEASRGDRAGLIPFDLSALAHDMAELYRGSMEDAGIGFTASIQDEITLRGDKTQISRLLANLLDNAVKYVPAGGTVRLHVAAGPTLGVADNGPGIAPDLLPHVFDRFRRGAGTGAGHGLGLALARAIAERHDMVLSVASTPMGTCFVMEAER